MADMVSACSKAHGGGGGARWYKGTERGNAGSARDCTANSAAGVGKTPNTVVEHN